MAKAVKPKGNGKAAVQPPLASLTMADLQALVTSFAHLPEDGGDEALDLAQEKAFEAMEARTARQRALLAREALALSPLCADAYLVLAADAKHGEDALALYRQAVDAGAEALGSDFFSEEAGYFWGLIQTRPYMRARASLAQALRQAGDHDAAIEHYQDMLRLNPNDNQGIRHLLMDALLDLGRDAEAAVLWKRYRLDSSAVWTWSAALLAFRTKGRRAARTALTKALTGNRHVPDYLLHRKPLPRTLPMFIGQGDRDEAIAYVHDAAAAWQATPDAIAWLAATLDDELPPAVGA